MHSRFLSLLVSIALVCHTVACLFLQKQEEVKMVFQNKCMLFAQVKYIIDEQLQLLLI